MIPRLCRIGLNVGIDVLLIWPHFAPHSRVRPFINCFYYLVKAEYSKKLLNKFAQGYRDRTRGLLVNMILPSSTLDNWGKRLISFLSTKGCSVSVL